MPEVKHKEVKSNSDIFEIYLGTFIDDAFTWYSISKHKDPTEAYKEFKKYVNTQLKYTDEELRQVWDTGRLDIELRQGNKLLNWVGIYSREVKPLSEKEEKEAEKADVKEKDKDDDKSKKDSLTKDSFEIDEDENVAEQIWNQIELRLKQRGVNVINIVRNVHDAIEDYQDKMSEDEIEELRNWMANAEDELNSPEYDVKEIDDSYYSEKVAEYEKFKDVLEKIFREEKFLVESDSKLDMDYFEEHGDDFDKLCEKFDSYDFDMRESDDENGGKDYWTSLATDEAYLNLIYNPTLDPDHAYLWGTLK